MSPGCMIQMPSSFAMAQHRQLGARVCSKGGEVIIRLALFSGVFNEFQCKIRIWYRASWLLKRGL